MKEDIERIFLEDIRDKKKTGSGIFSRTGTRGYVGKMRTTVDLLKGKEKRQYQKNGKVERFIMYDVICTWEKLLTFPKEEQKERIVEWRKRFKTKVIAERLGTEQWRLYELMKKLGVQTRQIDRTKTEIQVQVPNEVITPTVVVAQQPEVTDGMALRLNGVFEGTSLADRILKFASLLDADSSKYRVSLLIVEETN